MSDAKSFVLLVIREDCWKPYFEDFSWLSLSAWGEAGAGSLRDCVAASVSKSLGYGIIAGSVIVKLPQLRNVIAARSGAGLSLDSQLLEFVSNALAVIYYALYKGSPFSAYGETTIVSFGCLLVISAMLYFANAGRAQGLSRFALSVLVVAAFVPAVLNRVLQSSPLPLPAGVTGGHVALLVSQLTFWSSRLMQIVETERAQSNGAQSIITLVANVLGTVARVYTSMREVGDLVQLACTGFNAALNAYLLWQFIRISRSAAAPAKVRAPANVRAPSTKAAAAKPRVAARSKSTKRA